MGKRKESLKLAARIEPATSVLHVDALTTTPSCCYAYVVYKIDTYPYVKIIHSSNSLYWKQLHVWSWNKNQNVANKEMKTTIIHM